MKEGGSSAGGLPVRSRQKQRSNVSSSNAIARVAPHPSAPHEPTATILSAVRQTPRQRRPPPPQAQHAGGPFRGAAVPGVLCMAPVPSTAHPGKQASKRAGRCMGPCGGRSKEEEPRQRRGRQGKPPPLPGAHPAQPSPAPPGTHPPPRVRMRRSPAPPPCPPRNRGPGAGPAARPRVAA